MIASPVEKSIFLNALELSPPEERRAYLDEACREDAQLRAGVEALLAAHDRLVGPAPGSADTATADLVAGPVATTVQLPSAPEPGALVAGRYKLLEVIGEGGMGIVWLAEQTEPVRRMVAVKLIRMGMDSRQVVARFEAERQALALMDHPNIAKVLDGGMATDGRPFFVIELVKGSPITKYCDDHRLTLRERLDLFASVCRAVQHAHQKGVIHRDIKPSNVLVAPYDGHPVPKVIDFGIAKATGQPLTDKTLFTGFGAVLGTPEYMSPEQSELNNADIDTRSDVYSLGVLLYELLTGSTPLTRKRAKEGALLEVLRLVREEEAPRPSTRLSTAADLATVAVCRGSEPKKLSGLVRGELDWIVMRALEKDRNRRYETANALALDLQCYLADEPVQACPPSAGYRLRKFVRRNRGVASVIGLVAALLLIGTAVSTALAVWAIRAEGTARDRLESEQAEKERAVEAEREGKRQLVRAKLAQVRAGRSSRQVGQRFEGLKSLTEAAKLARGLEMDQAVRDDLRDEMVACLATPDVRSVDAWPGWPAGSVGAPRFDADLEQYARSDDAGNIEVRQVAGDRLLARFRSHGRDVNGPGVFAFRFSPDGTLLAAIYGHQIPGQPTNCQVWDWRRQEVVFRPTFMVDDRTAIAFGPDGRQLGLGQRDGTVTLYEVIGWKAANRLKAASAPASLAYHPDGTRLAIGCTNGTVQVLEVATGKALYEVHAGHHPWRLAWHPRGDLLAAAFGDSTVRLWDGASGQPHLVLRGHQNAAIGVTFAADGDALVSTSWDGSSRVWNSWTGRELFRFAGETHQTSRDGRRLASLHGRTLIIREVDPGSEYFTLALRPGRGDIGWALGVSPDGRWLVRSGTQGRLWDLALRREVDVLPGGFVNDATFHPTRPELLTSGPVGLCRWSFEVKEEALHIRRINRLLPPGRVGAVSLDREGRRAVVIHGPGATLLDLQNPTRTLPPLEHGDGSSAAVSPDGRWAVTGVHNGSGARVWNTRTGTLEKELLPKAPITRAIFSPDGRWLLISSETEIGIWESGTWRPVWQTPREQVCELAAAFTADGKVLAVKTAGTRIQLFDTETWHPLVGLQPPDDDMIEALAFTPDGTRLLVSGSRGAARVWDLRRIREQLAEVGLDWDRPAYAVAPPAGDVKPLRIEVEDGLSPQLAKAEEALKEWETHVQAKRWPQAVEACTRALETDPSLTQAWVRRGRCYAERGRWGEARSDYSRAIQLDPFAPPAWFERGRANYELGQWEQSLADYSQVIKINSDNVLAHDHRGNVLRAAGRYEEAIKAYEAALRVNLYHPHPSTDLAWLLATCPDPRFRDAGRAVELAARAVKRVPGAPHARGTLGAALYRVGKYQESVTVLEGALKDLPDDPQCPHFALCLAMACRKLGKETEAREWFDRAVTWKDKNPLMGEGRRRDLAEQFRGIRAEAETVIGIKK